MKAWDYECVTYDAAHWCVGCLPEGVTVDSEGVHPVFPTEEVDSYPTCDECHEEHTYMTLTSDGQRWLLERRHRKKECEDSCAICKEEHDRGECPPKKERAKKLPKKHQDQKPLHCGFCEEEEEEARDVRTEADHKAGEADEP